MKTILILLLAQLPLVGLHADYLGEFEKLKKDGNSEKIEAFLKKAAAEQQDNPEYYATASNYWWGVSQSVSITTKGSEKDDFSVRDQKTGKEVGSISTVGRANPEIPKKAITILREGTRRFPRRADLWLGLAHVQMELGMRSDCVETLLGLLAASREKDGLQWTKNGNLPSIPSKFIPEAVQKYSVALYRAESAEADALSAKLCEATIKAFPDHPFAYNISAALATAHKKYDEALRHLETASAKAPDDALILLNLGDAYRRADTDPEAKKVFEKVLKLPEVDDSMKKQARKALEAIQSSTKGSPEKKP